MLFKGRKILIIAAALALLQLSCGRDDLFQKTADAERELTTYYIVAYNSNGAASGTVPIDSSLYKHGNVVTAAGNTGGLIRSGFTFSGWNTSADGSGTNYSQGQAFTIGYSNVILYARWTNTITYTVTYQPNGALAGDVPADTTNYITGQTITVSANTGSLVRAGYSFIGWNTQADGLGTNYTFGQTFAMGTEPVVLYANWSSNPTYSVIYDANGSTGGFIPIDSTFYESGQSVTVLDNTGNLEKTGYSFEGWNSQADGLGTDFAPGTAFAMGTMNTTLYAKWIELPPTNGLAAEYLFNGNANDTSGNSHNGTVNGALTAPDRFGTAGSAYSFDGSSHIELPESNTIISDPMSSYSVSFWFKVNSYTANAIIISSANGVSETAFFLHSGLDRTLAMVKLFNKIREPGIDYETTANDNTNDGAWHHAVIVTDKSELKLKLYLDNQLADSTDISNSSFIDNGIIRIGAVYAASLVNFFTGLVDDIRFYNRQLTLLEITNLYHENNWSDRVSKPQFDKPGGFYQGPQMVALTCPTSGASIYYTTDGSDPTVASSLYSAPVNILLNSTVIVKAKAFASGKIPSPVVKNTYETTTDYVIQPGSEGIDTFAGSIYSTNGRPDEQFIDVGGWGDSYFSWLQFDLTSAPATASSARIRLYCYSGTVVSMYLDRVTSYWDESVTWSLQPSSVNISTIAAPTVNSWYEIDITGLYNDWQSSTYPNYGIQLSPTDNTNDFNIFFSSDFIEDPSLRPALIITP